MTLQYFLCLDHSSSWLGLLAYSYRCIRDCQSIDEYILLYIHIYKNIYIIFIIYIYIYIALDILECIVACI